MKIQVGKDCIVRVKKRVVFGCPGFDTISVTIETNVTCVLCSWVTRTRSKNRTTVMKSNRAKFDTAPRFPLQTPIRSAVTFAIIDKANNRKNEIHPREREAGLLPFGAGVGNRARAVDSRTTSSGCITTCWG